MQQFNKKRKKSKFIITAGENFEGVGETLGSVGAFFRTVHNALDPSTFVFHDPAVGPWSGNGVLGSVNETGACWE